MIVTNDHARLYRDRPMSGSDDIYNQHLDGFFDDFVSNTTGSVSAFVGSTSGVFKGILNSGWKGLAPAAVLAPITMLTQPITRIADPVLAPVLAPVMRGANSIFGVGFSPLMRIAPQLGNPILQTIQITTPFLRPGSAPAPAPARSNTPYDLPFALDYSNYVSSVMTLDNLRAALATAPDNVKPAIQAEIDNAVIQVRNSPRQLMQPLTANAKIGAQTAIQSAQGGASFGNSGGYIPYNPSADDAKPASPVAPKPAVPWTSIALVGIAAVGLFIRK